MPKDRIERVKDLICGTDDLASIKADLGAFDWDYKGAPVELRRDHIRAMIQRFTSGSATSEHVAEWADLIEMRSDISFEPGFDELIISIIFDLANPEINGALDLRKAATILKALALTSARIQGT
jgi:hypothetical protein